MTPECEFLTKTLFDPGVFWAMVTAVGTIGIMVLAVLPLRDLAKTRRTELVRRLKDDFWTPRTRIIMFLVNHNYIEYQKAPMPFFSFASISNDPARGLVSGTFGDTVVLGVFEIDDDLLNPLEEVAVLAFAKSISFEDVFTFFGQFMKSVVENEEIRKHILDVRKQPKSANAWMNLERIIPILDRLDQKLSKRLSPEGAS